MEWLNGGVVGRIDRRGRGKPGFGALTSAIWRGKWWIVGATVVSLVAALATTGFVQRRYTSEALLLRAVGDANLAADASAPAAQRGSKVDSEDLTAQVKQIVSPDLARQAIAKLGLVDNPEFNPSAPALSPVARLLMPTSNASEAADASPEDRALRAYFERLEVNALPDAGELRIKFSAADPKLAANAANVIAELYLSTRAQAKADPAPKTASLEPLERKAAAAQSALDAFRARHGLVAGGDKLTAARRQSGELAQALAAARSAQAAARAKADRTRVVLVDGGDASYSEGDDGLRRIAQQDSALHREFAADSQVYLAHHPRIIDLRSKLAYYDNALRTAAQGEARRRENEANLASRQVETLTASLNAARRNEQALEAEQAQLNALARDAAAARQQLDAARAPAGAPASAAPAPATPLQGQVLVRAVPAQPPLPDISTLLVSAFSGFLLSLGAVVAREALTGSNALRPSPQLALPARIEQVIARARPSPAPLGAETLADAPLAAVPAAAQTAPVATATDAAPLAVPLARRIEALKPTRRAAAVLVCGLERAPMATVAALEVSRDLARGARAILVLADDSGAGLYRFVDDHGVPGLADLAAGRTTPDQAIHADLATPLTFLPLGRRAANETLDPRRLDVVFDALVASHDYVVLNGPPFAETDRSLALARWADMVVLVVASEEGPPILAAIDKLVDAGLQNIQVVRSEEES